MTSQQKIQQLAEQLLSQHSSGMIGASLQALAPQMLRQLPTDPATLDQGLYECAAAMLMCRSDDARPLAIVYADEHGLALAVDAVCDAVEEPEPALAEGATA